VSAPAVHFTEEQLTAARRALGRGVSLERQSASGWKEEARPEGTGLLS